MKKMIRTQTKNNPIIILASLVVVLAGIKTASAIVVPLLLSLFIAVIVSPFFLWLKKKGLHQGVALVIVLTVLFIGIWKLMFFLGASAQDFSQNASAYQEKLHEHFIQASSLMQKYGVEVPVEDLAGALSIENVMHYVAKTLKSFSSLLANFFMIFLMVAFILLEISSFSRKLHSIHSDSLKFVVTISEKIQHFIMLKSLTSLATGSIIAAVLSLLGVDYAMLWGLVAFLLNFIPNIGSIIAAVPAVLIALVQYDFTMAAVVAGLYLAVNISIGSILEPRIMGEGLGLSTLVVFLSLVFWGWLLGPVGMLLSIPLTIMAKIALAQKQETRWIATLLGN